MVQGAVYDAVNAIDRGHRPYLVAPPAKRSDSKQAAAATAAFRVLAALFPSQQSTLQPLYDASLAAVPDGRRERGGIAAGDAAAAAMLAARANDGRNGPFTFPIGSEPGAWRPTPPTFALDPAPWVGNVRPFLVPSAAMIRSDPPNPLTSTAYAQRLQRGQGNSARSRARPARADQTEAAIFWQDHGPALWNRVFARSRPVTDSTSPTTPACSRRRTSPRPTARSAAGTSKYYWKFWRPITAIREAASDGNPATEADPAWTPLFDPTTPQFGTPLVTPGFPDHPAGHGCISGAIVRTLQRFFGTDKIAFSAFSNRTHTTRSYDRPSQALKEIINARVWGGIHFRTADVQGAALGNKVAHWLAKHYFQPVR